jgi:nicotinic acid phosphoribosyltransferase
MHKEIAATVLHELKAAGLEPTEENALKAWAVKLGQNVSGPIEAIDDVTIEQFLAAFDEAKAASDKLAAAAEGAPAGGAE